MPIQTDEARPIGDGDQNTRLDRGFSWLLLPLLLLAVLASTPLIDKHDGFDSDGRHYGRMAGAPLDVPTRAPWCYRVLTPWQASLLPFDTLVSFRVLAYFSVWFGLAMLHGLLRRVGFAPAIAALGTLLFMGVFWTTKFAFYSPAYVDYQTTALVLGVLLLLATDRYWPIPLLLGIGVLQKESVLLLAPVAFVAYARQGSWLRRNSVLYGLALVLPAALALVFVRSAIEPASQHTAVLSLQQLREAMDPSQWPRYLAAVWSGLGLLPVVLLLGARSAWEMLRREPHLAILFGFGIAALFAGIDAARLFLFGLPVWVLCASQVLADLRFRMRAFWPWAAVLLILHFGIGHYLSPMGSFEEYLSAMVPVHAASGSFVPRLVGSTGVAIFVGLTALFLLRRGRRLSAG